MVERKLGARDRWWRRTKRQSVFAWVGHGGSLPRPEGERVGRGGYDLSSIAPPEPPHHSFSPMGRRSERRCVPDDKSQSSEPCPHIVPKMCGNLALSLARRSWLTSTTAGNVPASFLS